MKHLGKLILTVAVPAVAALSGCGGESQNTVGAIPRSQQFVDGAAKSFQRISAPGAVKHGIYVSSYGERLVLGFKSHYHHGRGPFCTIFARRDLNIDITVDPEGNLIVPEGHGDSVTVYRGPDMCGPKLGEFKDPYGLPADAASFNAATGTIVIANLLNSERSIPGNLAICTLKSGCTKELQLSSPGYGGAVALAKNGDCWVSIENAASTAAAMTYWPHCTGTGETVTGYMNASYGSLSIDKKGNLVSIDTYSDGGRLWVYSGCNPNCTVVGGPFPLQDNPIYGALNAKGDTFGVMEAGFLGGTVDIYSYSPTKLTYKYSFASHYAPAATPSGFAYSPALNL
jgi:hypothetical protein